MQERVRWYCRKTNFLGLPISSTNYTLTDMAIIIKTGLLTITEEEIDLRKITNKKLITSFLQRKFDCGTLILSVRNSDVPIKKLKGVRNPRYLLSLLNESAEEIEDELTTRVSKTLELVSTPKQFAPKRRS